MSKHLPPPKNKHVKNPGARTNVKRNHKRAEDFKKANIYFLILAGALLAAMYFVPLEGWKLKLAYLVPFLAAGWKIIIEAFDELFGGNIFAEPVLVSFAGIAAMTSGLCAAAVIIMLAYSAICIVRSYAELKKKRLLGSISSLCPTSAQLETKLGTETVGVERLCVGDIIRVEHGERIALDGIVISGEADVDCYAITGNSKPVSVCEGSSVVSGCTNLGDVIRVRVTKDYTESTVCRIVSYIEQYEDFKPRQFRLAENFIDYFTVITALLAIFVSIVPPVFNSQWMDFISRGISLMAIAGPSTLFASVSLAYFGGIGGAVYGGGLVKDANHLEALANSETMVFGRTRIITEGRYKVNGIFPVKMDEESLLSIAATAESESSHPIALALKEASKVIEQAEDETREFIALPGRGVSSFILNSHVYVGNALLMEEHGIEWVTPVRPGTAVHVAIDNEYAGHIIVTDDIREGAFDAIEDLRLQGVKQSVLLTGAVRSASRKIASSLNFDMLKAELTPDAKISALEYLKATKNYGTSLAYVGIGTTDKELMDCADIGIAMGAFGCYEALENADVVIMDSDIRALPYIRKIALDAVNIAKLNIYVCIAAKLILGIFALLGILGPIPTVILDTLTSLALIINAFRALNKI